MAAFAQAIVVVVGSDSVNSSSEIHSISSVSTSSSSINISRLDHFI